MDLSAAIEEPVVLKPLERTLIPTGIKIELEHGYEAQVRPRSGLSIKHGITLINCVGTVDEDYRGELCVPVVNLSNEAYTIQPGERIAQMVIARVEQAKIEIVEELFRCSDIYKEIFYGQTIKKNYEKKKILCKLFCC